MSHTYTNILIHALLALDDRRSWLSAEVREEVFGYLGGTVNELGGAELSSSRSIRLIGWPRARPALPIARKNSEFLMRRAGHDFGAPAEPSAF